MLQIALRYARLGFSVFPLSPDSKIPLSREKMGLKDGDKAGVSVATIDESQITKWWTDHPDSNVGLALGRVSGIMAVDLDLNHGGTREDLKKFPRTVTVKTKNGYHVYFKYDPRIKAQAIFGGTTNEAAAFLRSDGLYMVAPGSVVDEFEYQFLADSGGELTFSDCPLVDFPRDLLPTKVATKEDDKVKDIPINHRHNTLVKYGARLRKQGKTAEEISDILNLRNEQNCKPPIDRERFARELPLIVEWIMQNVQVNFFSDFRSIKELNADYIIPLGHKEGTYYYTSSDNKEIVLLPKASHSGSSLFDLMPYEWWVLNYPGEKKGVNWLKAASDMMESCRQRGVFWGENIRGCGCWFDKGRFIIHMGDRLLVDGEVKELNDIQSDFIYALRRESPMPHDTPLSLDDCLMLVEACAAPEWQNDSSGVLLAGWLATARLCGALTWRPHLWVTGGAGTGKSTVLKNLCQPIMGDMGLYILGETTAAGIRQRLEWDSKPVIFDEAETNSDRSGKRIQSVLELARQASFDSEGVILKGTPDGSGHSYKITSQFMLASIRVNLIEEADHTRFCVLSLSDGRTKPWPVIEAKINRVTKEMGDRLFTRMIAMWPTFLKNLELFHKIIGQAVNPRQAQQLAPLLAGYCCLIAEQEIGEETAEALFMTLGVAETTKEALLDGKDETECINWLLYNSVSYDSTVGRVTDSVIQLVNNAENVSVQNVLAHYGMKVEDLYLWIATTHPVMQKFYKDSKWGKLFPQSLLRIKGARVERKYFSGTRIRCVGVPVKNIIERPTYY